MDWEESVANIIHKTRASGFDSLYANWGWKCGTSEWKTPLLRKLLPIFKHSCYCHNQEYYKLNSHCHESLNIHQH